MLYVGERACDLAEVTQIRPDVVVVRNLQTGRLESLTLPDAGTPRAARAAASESLPDPVVESREPGVVNVDVPKAAVDHYLVNLSDLLSSAQAVPHAGVDASGRRIIDGFELRQVKPGSVIEKAGLKDGDVIAEVNGVTLDGLPTVLRAFGQAQAAGQATLTVLRGSQRLTFVLTTR
jgi:S1-C subfamily serine protease